MTVHPSNIQYEWDGGVPHRARIPEGADPRLRCVTLSSLQQMDAVACEVGVLRQRLFASVPKSIAGLLKTRPRKILHAYGPPAVSHCDESGEVDRPPR